MTLATRIERLERSIVVEKIDVTTWATALREVDRETYDRFVELVTAMTPEEINARRDDPKRDAAFQKMVRLIVIARNERWPIADFRRRFMALVNDTDTIYT